MGKECMLKRGNKYQSRVLSTHMRIHLNELLGALVVCGLSSHKKYPEDVKEHSPIIISLPFPEEDLFQPHAVIE